MAQQQSKPIHGHVVSFAFIFAVLLGFSTASHAVERFETPVGFNVSPTGAANFNIPIEVPPGTAGMAPALSLGYSSQGGNGMLGMGWSLGGLSAIYRCGRTLIQDGVTDTVNYNASDRYCMDGQRLVAVSGAYGANGTEYRTERESFTKVISYSTVGSGPAYFVAWTKAGQIIEFGNTVDSRIEAQGKADVRIWAVNKVSDTVSNYLTITYTEDNANGDYRPNRIDYTGNAAAAIAPYNSVRFVYQSRTDISPVYQTGSVIKTMLRLANVQTYAKVGATDTLVKDYRLAYEPDVPATFPKQSRITSLTECQTDGTCLPATRIGWPEAVTSLIIPPTQVIPVYMSATAPFNMPFVDFNGDGKADYMQRPIGQTYWNIAYSTGEGFTTPVTVIPVNAGGAPSYPGSSTYQRFADFNGDGMTDYMYIPVGQYYWMLPILRGANQIA